MLINITKQEIKFSEVDSLRIVWHGHYVRYFEDGREAFGKQYGLHYLDIYKHGFAIPLVDLEVQFKRVLEYGDAACIETRFVNSPAAKIMFEYTITSATHGYVVCVGKSTQVFMDPVTKELHMTTPAFFKNWKEKWQMLS